MPEPEDIVRQQELLRACRRTLQHLLLQVAYHGGVIFAPPQTANGIDEARACIARCKASLRAWGVPVEDLPDDADYPDDPPAGESAPPAPRDGPPAPNPFGDIGRIARPERFFDREDLLRQVFEELGKGVSLALVGESRVGKSSLLAMICALGPQRLGRAYDSFAYLSLELVDDEDEFYALLCERLGLAACRGLALARALAHRRAVLCLDEVEKMAWDGFTARLRSHLRGLADGADAPLTLVIAARSPLAQLFPDSSALTSPLAGICRQLDVGPFAPAAARAFLDQRLRGTGVSFSADQTAELLAASGCHPARLQDAAAALYRRLAGGG